MSGLSLDSVAVGYGARKVLSGLTLPDLKAGEVTVIAGPNAVGKSTLLRAIAQLAPYDGQISLAGRNLAALTPGERSDLIGLMPQTIPGGAGLIVLETVITALRASGNRLRTARVEAEAMAVLERLEIGALALDHLSRLSGGQRQMVSLAQAIVRDPRLLLLDEPTSALDLSRQVRLLSELRRIAAEGRVVVAVLHDLALAARWADRIVMLDQGRIYSLGAPEDVVTPKMLAEVYHVDARVERASRNELMILIDGEVGNAA